MVPRQSAEVMLMMRDEGQMSSDFQEYTLIALFSLAAHLAGGVAAERASLPAMARYYNQDEDTLSQVLHSLCPCSCLARPSRLVDTAFSVKPMAHARLVCGQAAPVCRTISGHQA